MTPDYNYRFENAETRVLASWNLFCPFAKVIGRKSKLKLMAFIYN